MWGFVGVSCNWSAMRARSGKDDARILRITDHDEPFIVIFAYAEVSCDRLFKRPVTTNAMTSRSRGVKVSKRALSPAIACSCSSRARSRA